MSRTSWRPAVVAAALAVLTIAGCTSGDGRITILGTGSTTTAPDPGSGSGSAPAVEQLSWGTCRQVDIAVSSEVRTAATGAGMECASLDVPLDHASPGGRTISLAVARLAATGPPSRRIGSLIVNPGGPGGSGLEFLANAGPTLPASLRQRFDVVSFDPRGVAASTPLDCLSNERRKAIAEAQSPSDPAAEAARSASIEAEVAAGCTADDAELAGHIGTDQVVGDLDSLRVAVGDRLLTYLGLSYGTRIGAAYATAHPDRVRAIVLDGSVDPSRDLVDFQAGQQTGVGRALQALAAHCDTDPSCPLAPRAMDVMVEVADALERRPLDVETATGTERLTRDQFVTGIVTALYDPSSWSAVDEAVAALSDATGSGGNDDTTRKAGRFLLYLAGQQSSKEPDGSYGNGFETQAVINCLDADGPLDGDDLARARAQTGALPPLLADEPEADATSCVSLPTGDGLDIGATDARDRILVVGTRGDPATPYEWTTKMVAALGGPAVVTYAGNGHTAGLRIKCVTERVTSFLDEGSTRAPTAECPLDPGESDIYASLADQFESLGLSATVGACVADTLRTSTTSLDIVSLGGSDPDPGVISELQRAVGSCR